jgi:hypothetical protein
MMRLIIVAAVAAAAAGFNAPASKVNAPAARPAASAPRFALVQMSEPSDKGIVVGASAVGGILGVYLFGDLGTAVFLACAGAYGATLSNGFGSASKSAGTFAAKAYDKTLEINEQYDVLPKAKSALDTVSTAAANLDANYGITAKIDEQLQLSQAVDKVTDKIDEVKSSVSSKVDDLKSKASSS